VLRRRVLLSWGGGGFDGRRGGMAALCWLCVVRERGGLDGRRGLGVRRAWVGGERRRHQRVDGVAALPPNFL